MAEEITLQWNGRPIYTIDNEEFEIIKLMVEKAGAKDDLKNILGPIEELVAQGYEHAKAMRLCILARHTLIDAQ